MLRETPLPASGTGRRNGAVEVTAMPVDPDRLRLVEHARQAWRGRLIDVSRRNNLLYFRHLKTGTLDLGAVAEGLAPLLRASRNGDDEPSVALRRLYDPDTLSAAVAKLQEIRRRALVNYEERGLETLHLVLGFATWRPDDDGSPPNAPVLLMPIASDEGGRDGRSLSLKRAGDAVPNRVLLHALERAFKVTLSADELADVVEGEEGAEQLDLEGVFRRIRKAAKDVAGGSRRAWRSGTSPSRSSRWSPSSISWASCSQATI